MSTSLKINPYLNFNGTTEAAFLFYRSVFGGEFSAFQRFGDIPPGAGTFAGEEAKRVMHVALPIGDSTVLMGSDICESQGQKLTVGNNVHLSLHPETLAEAERLFGALSVGGAVEMPLTKMFWGSYYAAFTDRYGVRWMINCMG